MGLYRIPVTTINDATETLAAYRSQALLNVNVASKCAPLGMRD